MSKVYSPHLTNYRVFTCPKNEIHGGAVMIAMDDRKPDISAQCAICGRTITRSHVASVFIVRDLPMPLQYNDRKECNAKETDRQSG